MNFFLLIVVAIAGIIIGSYFGVRKNESLIFGQAKKKRENKERILEFLQSNEKIRNNDIEKLLKVSDATATRYLNELEKEQKIKQIGTVGHAVYYRLIKP
ncbi:winged helix-turn-helix transcriptional regulator [Candidatus Parcubacteria bacterium]|nr:winged helix-turn-helix transcriptional regulator [Candidatus Parcubacteria bacterium]